MSKIDWKNRNYSFNEQHAHIYKRVALELISEYLDSEETVISEYSGDFKQSAEMLKARVIKYLKQLDESESENIFNELVKGMWIAEYYTEVEDE